MTTPELVLTIYLVCINLASFAVMGADKRRARREAWRIRERTLFLLAIVGGSVGAIAGMYAFHHKTRHWYFKWGLPATLIAQLALGIWLFWIWNGRP